MGLGIWSLAGSHLEIGIAAEFVIDEGFETKLERWIVKTGMLISPLAAEAVSWTFAAISPVSGGEDTTGSIAGFFFVENMFSCRGFVRKGLGLERIWFGRVQVVRVTNVAEMVVA